MASTPIHHFDVMVSYAWEADGSEPLAVRRLNEELARAGLTVWQDRRQLNGGDELRILIAEAASRCSVMIVVASERYEASCLREDGCAEELRLALERKALGKAVFAVNAGTALFPDGSPKYAPHKRGDKPNTKEEELAYESELSGLAASPRERWPAMAAGIKKLFFNQIFFTIAGMGDKAKDDAAPVAAKVIEHLREGAWEHEVLIRAGGAAPQASFISRAFGHKWGGNSESDLGVLRAYTPPPGAASLPKIIAIAPPHYEVDSLALYHSGGVPARATPRGWRFTWRPVSRGGEEQDILIGPAHECDNKPVLAFGGPWPQAILTLTLMSTLFACALQQTAPGHFLGVLASLRLRQIWESD